MALLDALRGLVVVLDAGTLLKVLHRLVAPLRPCFPAPAVPSVARVRIGLLIMELLPANPAEEHELPHPVPCGILEGDEDLRLVVVPMAARAAVADAAPRLGKSEWRLPGLPGARLLLFLAAALARGGIRQPGWWGRA